jgi:hypothetical protein
LLRTHKEDVAAVEDSGRPIVERRQYCGLYCDSLRLRGWRAPFGRESRVKRLGRAALSAAAAPDTQHRGNPEF